MRDVVRDVVFAGRLFGRQPGIVLLTVAGLALAVGISTAVFSLVNALAIRGYGIRDAHDVFRLQRLDNREVWFLHEFTELQRGTRSIDVTAMSRGASSRRIGHRAVDRLDDLPTAQGLPVSGNYFQVLRARPAVGRLLQPDDDRSGAPPVVVLAHLYWRRAFAGDATIVGRTIWIDNRAMVVVGVAEAGFLGPFEPGIRPPDIWVTLAAAHDGQRETEVARARGVQARIDAIVASGRLTEEDRDRLAILGEDLKLGIQPPAMSTVHVVGRLAPSVPRVQAETEATSIIAATALGTVSGPRPTVSLVPVNQRRAVILETNVSVVLCGVMLLIVLACVNIANLLLASGATREREIATRLALGAGRSRIVRQLVTESAVLGGGGGILGLLLATWLAPVVAFLAGFGNTDVTPDVVVYAFAVVAATAVALGAALAPVRHSRRADLATSLRTGRPSAGSGATSSMMRSVLVGGQAGASVLLLVIGALLTHAFIQAATVDHGIATDRLVSASVWFSRGYFSNPTRMDRYWEDALDRIRALPGVAAASLASQAPFDGATSRQRTSSSLTVTRISTRSDYFDVAGARILRGRAYSPVEVRDGAAVVVITDRLARTFWGDENPIGSDMARVWEDVDSAGTPRRWSSRPREARIVGVVADSLDELDTYNEAAIYMPLLPGDLRGASLIVRATSDPEPLVNSIRDALETLDSGVTIREIGSVRSRVSGDLVYPRSQALFALLVGGSALGLAVVGLFGVTAFTVAQRRHEIGIRLALGATHRSVVRLMLRDNLKPVIIGLTIGTVVSLFATQLIRANLYGIDQRDPVAIAAAAAVLLLTAGLAAFLPARRAALVDPVEMLRL